MQLESSDFSARLRHYLQSEEIIHADYQGSFSSQSRVLRLHWIKITETCHLLAHRGREVGLVSVEHHQTFTQTLRHIHPSLNHKNIIIQFQSLSKFVSHPSSINEWKVVHIIASISPGVDMSALLSPGSTSCSLFVSPDPGHGPACPPPSQNSSQN